MATARFECFYLQVTRSAKVRMASLGCSDRCANVASPAACTLAAGNLGLKLELGLGFCIYVMYILIL